MKKHINQPDSQGRLHGLWEVYHPNGTLSWRAHFLHGKEHGLWESYYLNGTLFWRGHYHHGKAHGVWEGYLEDGILSRKIYCLFIR